MILSQMLACAMDIGEQMLISGAEIERVEDTISRICKAYDVKRVDVFSITSSIVVTVTSKEEEIITQTRRIKEYRTNFNKLDRLNNLSRYICENQPDIPYIKGEIKSIKKEKEYSLFINLIVSAIAAGVFAVFFGGSLIDGIVSACLGILLKLMMQFLDYAHSNIMFSDFIGTFIVSLIAMLFVHFGIGDSYDKIIIGNIMLLIPGLAFVNSLRDIISRDIMAGLMRLCEAIVLAIFIAIGSSAAILLGIRLNWFTKQVIRTSGAIDYFVQVITAFWGSFTFAILFGIKGKRIFFAGLAGFLTWGVCIIINIAIPSLAVPYFASAIFATIYAEIFARIFKTPTTTFLVPAIIPLVPGGYLYYTMTYAVVEEFIYCGEMARTTLTVALALAGGIMAVSSIKRICFALLQYNNSTYKLHDALELKRFRKENE